MFRIALAMAAAFLFLPTVASAQSPQAQCGLTFALANCARCHFSDKLSPSVRGSELPFLLAMAGFGDPTARGSVFIRKRTISLTRDVAI